MPNIAERIRPKPDVLAGLNPLSSCKRYGVSLWQCPQFLFLIMGVVILGAIVGTYFIGTLKIGDPFVVTLLVIVVATVLLVINFVITNSFERVAEASRMKTEFIDIVSHQLRAPLTNTRFALDFLMSDKKNPPSEKQIEYLEILQENSSRMSDLIDNLLTISRIETGTLPLKKEKVSLAALTNKLIAKFKPLIRASNVEVLVNSQDPLPDVMVDPLWIEQVVENLLDNAVRYSKGGGQVIIAISQKKRYLYFEIKDKGVGIPKVEQKYIFSKFFRSKNALKKQTEGSGLGLHICQKVVELSGGRIGFRSKEGQGTTFWFFLPVSS